MTARHTTDQATAADTIGLAAERRHDDALTFRGEILFELTRANGQQEVYAVRNLVTTVGRNAIADQWLAAPTLGKSTHMAVGTGAVAPALGDTALGAEIAGSRVALTSKTRAGNVVTMVGDFPAGTGTGAITEAGTFDAATTGNMPTRATFAAINKAAGDTLKITWTLTVA